MKIAIMQPYFFPYIGYFQLIQRVDLFVFLTGVQYIQRGWVNRNRLRGGDGWQYLTVPVEKAPLGTLICDMKTTDGWLAKHLRTLECVYGKNHCLNHPLYSTYKEIAQETRPWLCPLLINTVRETARYLRITTPMIDSATLSPVGTFEERVIDICKKCNARSILNPPGSSDLYDVEAFARHNIKLEVMAPTTHPNKLSILDAILGDDLRCLPEITPSFEQAQGPCSQAG